MMPTSKSYMDKIVGPTSRKAFKTIDRQKDAGGQRHSARVSRSKAAFSAPEPECDWRRLPPQQSQEGK